MNPQRERAWGRFYARRGLRFDSLRPLTAEERMSRWASLFYGLPADIRHGSKAANRARAASDSPR